jgi:uncharacterized protein YeaO (DUF488 family)
MPVQIKGVYDKPLKEGGFRDLVDRLWPRGLSREKGLQPNKLVKRVSF